jgi:hypothetical protein
VIDVESERPAQAKLEPRSLRTAAHAAIFTGLLLLASPAIAQLNGHNLRGDFGMQAGTQPPPGFYAGLIYAHYDVDDLRDRNGDSLPTDANINVDAVAPFLYWVSNFEILGAQYGFFTAPSWANTALESPGLGVTGKTDWGFGDLFVQPINLGWHIDRADFLFGAGVYAPTGRYSDDGDDNTGLGMWSFELSAGATAYFDAARTWHFATLAAWETHTEKKNSDVQVGDLLTLEGGLGKSWLDGTLSLGVTYFAQWKLTRDDPGSPADRFRRNPTRHEIYGIGPELVVPIATSKSYFGSLIFRYLKDFAVKNNSDGQTFLVMATIPIPSVPLQ